MTDFDDRTRTAAPMTDAPVRDRVVEVSTPGQHRRVLLREGVARIGRDPASEVAIDDPFLSRAHAEVRVAVTGVSVVDLGTKNGTFFQGARIRELPVRSDATVILGRHVPLRVRVLDGAQTALQPGTELIGEAPATQRLRAVIERLAPSLLTVLIEGETGTGKEVVARWIHARSLRSERPFVVFDCATASPARVAADLFGHTKGAFTDAAGATLGAFRSAHGGTLFLDEIGELPLELQPQLLRALEARQVKPVGGDAYASVDVRVIAATNRDLAREVEAGRFRSDLLYRLAAARITLPSLRARRADVRLLAEHFARGLGATLSPDVLRALEARAFPGNVRELRNVIERAVMLAGGPRADVTALEDELADDDEPAEPLAKGRTFQDLKQEVIDGFEREYLLELIRESGFNLSEAARRADVDRGHLRQLCRKHAIDVARLRGDGWPRR